MQFYRQKPIGSYVVDFYSPKAKLVIEVDGSQHSEEVNWEIDHKRDAYLDAVGLEVLRFQSHEVLRNMDAVLEVIYNFIQERLM